MKIKCFTVLCVLLEGIDEAETSAILEGLLAQIWLGFAAVSFLDFKYSCSYSRHPRVFKKPFLAVRHRPNKKETNMFYSKRPVGLPKL